MTNIPLNPADEARLEKALEQSANGQVVSRGSFAQYAQPTLNPDAIHAVMVKLPQLMWGLARIPVGFLKP